MKREYLDYVQDIFNSINDIELFTRDMDFSVFVQDRKTVSAAIRNLEVIGEAARNIPDEIKEKYPDIPWKNIVGMRDKLTHEYFGVDIDVVWKTVQNDLPALKEQILKLIPPP